MRSAGAGGRGAAGGDDAACGLRACTTAHHSPVRHMHTRIFPPALPRMQAPSLSSDLTPASLPMAVAPWTR